MQLLPELVRQISFPPVEDCQSQLISARHQPGTAKLSAGDLQPAMLERRVHQAYLAKSCLTSHTQPPVVALDSMLKSDKLLPAKADQLDTLNSLADKGSEDAAAEALLELAGGWDESLSMLHQSCTRKWPRPAPSPDIAHSQAAMHLGLVVVDYLPKPKRKLKAWQVFSPGQLPENQQLGTRGSSNSEVGKENCNRRQQVADHMSPKMTWGATRSRSNVRPLAEKWPHRQGSPIIVSQAKKGSSSGAAQIAASLRNGRHCQAAKQELRPQAPHIGLEGLELAPAHACSSSSPSQHCSAARFDLQHREVEQAGIYSTGGNPMAPFPGWLKSPSPPARPIGCSSPAQCPLISCMSGPLQQRRHNEAGFALPQNVCSLKTAVTPSSISKLKLGESFGGKTMVSYPDW